MGDLNPHYDVRYVEHVDPNMIWRWWFTEKTPGFIEKQNEKYDDFFKRFEKSVREEGFKNPLILTCGGGNTADIFRMLHENIEKDPVKAQMFDKFKTGEELLSAQLFATREGDGRIYIARKLGISVRSFILDYSGCYTDYPKITSLDGFMELFDPVYARNISNVRFTDTSIDFDIDPWVKMYFKPFEDKKDTQPSEKKSTRFFDLLRKQA